MALPSHSYSLNLHSSMTSLCGVYLAAAVLVGHHLNLSRHYSGDGYVYLCLFRRIASLSQAAPSLLKF